MLSTNTLKQAANHLLIWPFAGVLMLLWLWRHAGTAWINWGWRGGLLLLGFMAGLLFTEFDRRFLYAKYRTPGENDSLLTESMLFLAPFLLVAVFVITSTGSSLGVGLVLGIALNSAVALWQLRNTPDLLQQRFLPRLRRQLSADQARYLGWSALGAAGLLSLLSLLF